MQTEHKIPVSYWKAWRASQLTQIREQGTPESNFADLPAYCYMIAENNPGTIAIVKTDENDKFKYLFLSIGACIRAFTVFKKLREIQHHPL